MAPPLPAPAPEWVEPQTLPSRLCRRARVPSAPRALTLPGPALSPEKQLRCRVVLPAMRSAHPLVLFSLAALCGSGECS